jgi:hypothetical protein
LFTVNAATPCGTHELIGCSCISGTGDGIEPDSSMDSLLQEDSDNSDIEDWEYDADKDTLGTFMPASQLKSPKEPSRKVHAAYGDIFCAAEHHFIFLTLLFHLHIACG